jgi:hypothetical protein
MISVFKMYYLERSSMIVKGDGGLQDILQFESH